MALVTVHTGDCLHSLIFVDEIESNAVVKYKIKKRKSKVWAVLELLVKFLEKKLGFKDSEEIFPVRQVWTASKLATRT